jgi:hypothetical protein
MSMLETRAVVVQTDKLSAQVVASQGNGCSACDGKGCGSGKLTQLFCSRPRQFKVDNQIKAGVGDEVIVSVPEGAVLRGIGLVYRSVRCQGSCSGLHWQNGCRCAWFASNPLSRGYFANSLGLFLIFLL